MRNLIGVSGLLAAALAAGCATNKPTVARTPNTATATPSACRGATVAKPLGLPRTGSTVALARLGNKRVAFVADEDANAIETIDIDAGKELSSTALPGTPSQLMMTSDGRLLVLLRELAELRVLDALDDRGTLSVEACPIETAPEPVGLAASPDDATIFITSGWGRALGAFDGGSLKKRFEIPLPREPRAVVISDDGQRAFVSHAVGSKVSVIDLSDKAAREVEMRGGEARLLNRLHAQTVSLKEAERVPTTSPSVLANLRLTNESVKKDLRVGCQGFALAKSTLPAGRVLAPQVLVDPGNPDRRPEGYGNDDTETEIPSVAVLDQGDGTLFQASLLVTGSARMSRAQGRREARDHREECLLPRAAAVDPRTHNLLVACFGIDSVIAYDAASATPQDSERRRWTVGAGPSGIAVDPEKPQALVWSQFDRVLSVVPIDGSIGPGAEGEGDAPNRSIAKVRLAPLGRNLSAEVALGRMIFHSGGDTRISEDGRSCASCHPDGRDDALTWATPEGPRRSILLAGRVASTAPYSWNGASKSLDEHITKTFDRLNGTGLRSLELDALIAYLTTMRPPTPAGSAHSQGVANRAEIARGAEIFASKEAGCAGCHDSKRGFEDGIAHDVMSKTKNDRASQFDTPSLRFIGGTGAYFHDGRYADLHTLLTESDGKMGHTSHLSASDLDALESYLRTL